MAATKETVLYYNPEKSDKPRILKGVLVRMGIRIKNIGPEQTNQKVGYLAGLEGFEEESAGPGESLPASPEEVMLLYGFSGDRLVALLKQLRKNKASVALKAILTQTNCGWSFYQLYEEIREEHQMMSEGKTKH